MSAESSCTTGRSPYGERGLKYLLGLTTVMDDDGRSPYGERGLKYDELPVPARYHPSLSLRRAWIEILLTIHQYAYHVVALLTESVD